MNIAIVGDSFIDRYVFGTVDRISPEAPIPILNVEYTEDRGGGAINVANNLYSLGLEPTLFTITNMKLPYKVISPDNCISLIKHRFVCNNYQLLRVDDPPIYRKEDIDKMKYPDEKDFDIIAFVDYNKGLITGGKATIVDTKKTDLSVFNGSNILKINKKEFESSINHDSFKKYFITQGKDGIKYYENGLQLLCSPSQAKEIVDICGAGDTVMATLIYCLATGIDSFVDMMHLANKAAGIAISKFGTSSVSLKELLE